MFLAQCPLSVNIFMYSSPLLPERRQKAWKLKITQRPSRSFKHKQHAPFIESSLSWPRSLDSRLNRMALIVQGKSPLFPYIAHHLHSSIKFSHNKGYSSPLLSLSILCSVPHKCCTELTQSSNHMKTGLVTQSSLITFNQKIITGWKCSKLPRALRISVYDTQNKQRTVYAMPPSILVYLFYLEHRWAGRLTQLTSFIRGLTQWSCQ